MMLKNVSGKSITFKDGGVHYTIAPGEVMDCPIKASYLDGLSFVGANAKPTAQPVVEEKVEKVKKPKKVKK